MSSSDSDSMATLAFRMSQSSFMGPSSGGGSGGVIGDIDLSSTNMTVGKPFLQTVSKMFEALGYLESSLSLKAAIGTQAALSSLALTKSKIPGFYSRR